MSDVLIRVRGRAGRITLNRPAALNALTWDMCLAIEAALERWRGDGAVSLVVIDAVGDKAFCAGGDLAEMYRTGTAGDYDYGRRFWRDEYRLNAKIAAYPKPYVAFMQGYVMGGGVGVSCHGSHRVVGETSRIAMPECGVGLIPDVGGSWLLGRAPGRLGEYLGSTGHRMGPGDAIHAGFADRFVPCSTWASVMTELEDSGSLAALNDAAQPAPAGRLAGLQAGIDRVFSAPDGAALGAALGKEAGDWAEQADAALARQSPLSVVCALATIRAARGGPLPAALAAEYRFTHRCMERGDFLEGIRAAIVDKDRAPRWRHDNLAAVGSADVDAMLAPLGADELDLEGARP